MNAMIDYTYTKSKCRSVQLLQYFGEEGNSCGYCDICIEMKKKDLSESEFESIKTEIISYLSIQPRNIDFLLQHIIEFSSHKTFHVIQILLDEKFINYDMEMNLILEQIS
jgi:ATP-dependent DNA helicase RecQ